MISILLESYIYASVDVVAGDVMYSFCSLSVRLCVPNVVNTCLEK